MKLCYLDCFSGISGDMLLGALLDAGADRERVQAELAKLLPSGWSLSVARVKRGPLVATQVTAHVRETHPHRGLKEILDLIARAELLPRAAVRASKIFQRLAGAEARVHGVPVEKVHFHEVGAVDSILDIVGACVAFELLGIEEFACSALNLGGGRVQTAHGVLPVPAPATAELLRQAPTYSTGIERELVTPTGAAVVAALCTHFGAMPRMTVQQIGYGAGSAELSEQANVLRLFVGESAEAGREAEEPVVTVLEANLDDMSPLVGGYFLEEALGAGALDVYYTPVHMKKNRPGLLLTVICAPERADALSELIFQQTTTIGLRSYEARRRTLEREFVTVKTPRGAVRMKLAKLNGRILNAAPEYEDCQRLARESSVPLKQVLEEAQFYFRQAQKDRG